MVSKYYIVREDYKDEKTFLTSKRIKFELSKEELREIEHILDGFSYTYGTGEYSKFLDKICEKFEKLMYNYKKEK